MLSYLIRLIHDFECTHGRRPNLLYLNPDHLRHLRAGFDESYGLPAIMEMLQMEIVVDPGTAHPHVAWASAALHRHAG